MKEVIKYVNTMQTELNIKLNNQELNDIKEFLLESSQSFLEYGKNIKIGWAQRIDPGLNTDAIYRDPLLSQIIENDIENLLLINREKKDPPAVSIAKKALLVSIAFGIFNLIFNMFNLYLTSISNK